jgi:RNA polymerase sigma-70 factor (ECF subfamily)
MSEPLKGNSPETEALLRHAGQDDPDVLGDLFSRHTDRLKRMVRLRMDRRLQGRVDVADVLQESFLEALKCFPEYQRKPTMSFFVWLRCITSRQLLDIHRRHLGAKARDARREISIDQEAFPEATSAALAAQLLGCLTSPTEAAVRAERRARLQVALENMDPIDREILALRHFEQLSNVEAAEVLGIQTSAASKRHLRALQRLRQILKAV